MRQFNAQSTTDQVIEGISLAGRVALVTGASAGLGVETARVLASAGAQRARRRCAIARALSGDSPVVEQCRGDGVPFVAHSPGF